MSSARYKSKHQDTVFIGHSHDWTVDAILSVTLSREAKTIKNEERSVRTHSESFDESFGTSEVRRYYDANTRMFLRLGHGRRARAIHRAVWVERAGTREAAMHYLEECIQKEIQEAGALSVFDLGCGVGGSMMHLARSYQGEIFGITLSPVQEKLARDLFLKVGFAGRCHISQGDFLDENTHTQWRTKSRGPRIAYAIESFVHAEDPSVFFENLSGSLDTGDRLIICDDFLTEKGRTELSDSLKHGVNYKPGRSNNHKRYRCWLEEHRRGWHAHNRITLKELFDIAQRYSFRKRAVSDLTSCLELNRPRDRIIRFAVVAGRHLPLRGSIWDNLVGGNALQRCLTSGLLCFAYISLEKTAAL